VSGQLDQGTRNGARSKLKDDINKKSCVLITALVSSLYLFRLFVFWSRVTITWIMGLGVNKVEKDNFFEKKKQFFRSFAGLEEQLLGMVVKKEHEDLA
jgi:hypothetical protein